MEYLAEDRALIHLRLEPFVIMSKPYLDRDCTVKKLAQALRVPPNFLSRYINSEYKMNFNQFINRYRAEYAKSLIENGFMDSFSTDGLARDSGFNNRNTLLSAFKKFIGLTPTEYKKSLNACL